MIEGPRLLAEALDARVEVEAVFVEPRAAARVEAALARAGLAPQPVADGALDQVGDARTSQGVLAVVAAPALAQPLPAGADLVLVAVDVADPGNVGTLLRAADAAAAAVVLGGACADVLAPKVVRAAAGASFRVPVREAADAGEALDVLGRDGLVRLGAVARGGAPVDEVDLTGPVALVVGGEARGLPPGLDSRLDGLVSIPMPGRAESLNVAMAGTVVVFEALRQRRVRNRLDGGRLAGQGGRP